MATVKRFGYGGRTGSLDELVARHGDVQAGLGRAAGRVAADAAAILAGSRHEGHSQIETERGRIDHYVVLDDERGQGAAMTIEFGRSGRTRFRSGPMKGERVTAMEAVAPLRNAADAARKRRGKAV